MGDAVGCPKCNKPTISHCTDEGGCTWLRCTACALIFGPRNTISYSQTKAEKAKRRQNGL